MKKIGANFCIELEAAGLIGLPFSWGSDGSINYGPEMDAKDISKVKAVYSAHDPEKEIDSQN